jgi:hypothetical protein
VVATIFESRPVFCGEGVRTWGSDIELGMNGGSGGKGGEGVGVEDDVDDSVHEAVGVDNAVEDGVVGVLMAAGVGVADEAFEDGIVGAVLETGGTDEDELGGSLTILWEG